VTASSGNTQSRAPAAAARSIVRHTAPAFSAPVQYIVGCAIAMRMGSEAAGKLLIHAIVRFARGAWCSLFAQRQSPIFPYGKIEADTPHLLNLH